MTPHMLCATMGHMPTEGGRCLCGSKSYIKLSELTSEQREKWLRKEPIT